MMCELEGSVCNESESINQRESEESGGISPQLYT